MESKMPPPLAGAKPAAEVIDEAAAEAAARAAEAAEAKEAARVAKAAPSAGIMVVATRPGFYDKERRAVGQKFLIPGMHLFGSWMELADPVAEKRRKEEILKKEKAAKGLR